jgi:hypothetical protein
MGLLGHFEQSFYLFRSLLALLHVPQQSSNQLTTWRLHHYPYRTTYLNFDVRANHHLLYRMLRGYGTLNRTIYLYSAASLNLVISPAACLGTLIGRIYFRSLQFVVGGEQSGWRWIVLRGNCPVGWMDDGWVGIQLSQASITLA